jgi:hypothetical protein
VSTKTIISKQSYREAPLSSEAGEGLGVRWMKGVRGIKKPAPSKKRRYKVLTGLTTSKTAIFNNVF